MIDLELIKAQYEAEEEKKRQSNIVTARDYFNGDHKVTLTKRQQEFLGYNLDEQRFAVNYCGTVVNASAERLIVQGFDTSGDDDFGVWVSQVWKHNRMDAKQIEAHRDIINEGEYFVMVDWPDDAGYPRFLRHNRYTSSEIGGTGEGCKAHYVNENVDLGLECVSKRWVETYRDEKGIRRTRSRLNLYYPDRVERYVMGGGGRFGEATWERFYEVMRYIDEDGQEVEERRDFLVPWVDAQGKPLGIPFAHFRTGSQLELHDAIPLQDLINKTALDIIAAADAAGFPLRVAKGFIPTSDGKAPESGGGNLLELFPGAWIAVPADGGVDELRATELGGLLATLDSYIVKLAQVTDTPMSRFQLTRQVAAEGTLKQQEAVLLAKVRAYQTTIGNGWEDVLYKARRLAEARGQTFGEEVVLSTLWMPAETRDELNVIEQLKGKRDLGVPNEQLWSEMGYDADKIQEMKVMVAEELQATSNIGGELLRSFERGTV